MQYEGQHSIIFGDKHTFRDWKLMPTSRPLFNPPEPKTKYIELPGGNGSVDLTESLTGYPVYENRKGSLEFVVINDEWERWHTRYTKIMEYLHGRKMRAILDDDPNFYYEGRFNVSSWDSNNDGTWSNITIDYDVDPFKWSVLSSLDDWLWDPFNFYTGVILDSYFRNIDVPSNTEWTEFTVSQEAIGVAPKSPALIIDSDSGTGMDVKFTNTTLGIETPVTHYTDGKHETYDYVMYGTGTKFYFKGKGKVSIDFRLGRL